MIINDATVQLDEGLEVLGSECMFACKLVDYCAQNLAKVKEIEDLMASTDWKDLPDEDKKDVSSTLRSL